MSDVPQGPTGDETPDGAPADGAPDALDVELVDLLDAESFESAGFGQGEGSNVEPVLSELEQASQERDEYLDGLRRLQAEFENYKKAVAKREADARARANDSLVTELLPVLDACAMAAASAEAGAGSEDVARVQAALLEALTHQGLEILDPAGAVFDPEQHEAVMHEDGDGSNGLMVAEVLRTGYGWKGHVIRPAMVKTVG